VLPGGFDRDDVIIDHTTRTATCPAGHAVMITLAGNATFDAHGRGGPLRHRCTVSIDGRSLKISENDHELVEARRAWRDHDFTNDHRRWRPMMERSIAWLVADNHRRVRYRGTTKNQLAPSMRIATLNLRRLVSLGLHHDGAWTLQP
jgi:hypothetical protein